ncbi:MAG TPA: hypothetical protein VGJ58_11560 [Gaiellaceae bacterium]|jgi:hypothetical protein
MNAATISEKDLTGFVRDLAKTLGWTYYHTFLSVRSVSGFPDCVLLRSQRLVVCELKSPTGRTTEAQERWLEAWRRIPCAEVFVWTPADMDDIARVLR